MISLIVAYDRNGVIGKANAMPWYLPADLKHFKVLTVGHPVIMGRKTFDSVVARLGHPLPDRTNIVVTRDPKFHHDGAVVVNDLDTALAMGQAEGDVFVIGGAEIYHQTIETCDLIYATEIDASVAGDVYFPKFDKTLWQKTDSEYHEADDKNPYNYTFITYERLK